MRSLESSYLRDMTRVLITIIGLIHIPYSFSQELNDALTLRLGPGIGFPVNIELPSGTYIDITQRRNTWLHVQDERGEGGWATIADVGETGGLDTRLAWRLSELKKENYGNFVGRWFSNELGFGLSMGWKVSNRYGHWLAEIERATDAKAEWQAISSWYISEQVLTSRSYYSAGVGLGYSQESAQSDVFTELGQKNDSLFGGLELAVGIRPIKQLVTGLSLRYLFAASPGDADSSVVSWYWSFEL